MMNRRRRQCQAESHGAPWGVVDPKHASATRPAEKRSIAIDAQDAMLGGAQWQC
jgi:hypothetical protein